MIAMLCLMELEWDLGAGINCWRIGRRIRYGSIWQEGPVMLSYLFAHFSLQGALYDICCKILPREKLPVARQL